MKKNARFFAALWTAKLAALGLKALRRNASYFPGRLALKICPDFMGRVDKPQRIVAVTGTDGKTTTCNLLGDILTDQGEKVLSNKLGSNIDAGIATSLALGASVSGKAKYKTAVFEIDERSSRKIYPYVQPDYLICTNLSRDSVGRNAHPEYISNFINSAVPKKTKLILNGDDMISCRLAPGNEHEYYSIARMPSDRTKSDNLFNDAALCPVCHAPLVYDYVRNHHIGHAHCPSCGFESPKAKYTADVDLEKGTMKLAGQNFDLKTDTIYFAYDELAACALLLEAGYSADAISRSLKKIHIVESRYLQKTVAGKTVIGSISKGKNPEACSSVFNAVRSEKGTKEVLLMLDDKFDQKNSVENICWQFDADYQFLADPSIEKVAVVGPRCLDVKLALLLGGVSPDKIVTSFDTQKGPDLLPLKAEKIYFLYDNYYYPAPARSLYDRIIKRVEEKEASK